MHRPISAAALAAALLVLTSTTPASTPEAVERARALLARDDPRAAASALEAALPTVAAADRPVVLQELRKAYEAAAKQAEAAGKPTAARAYRDNLRILDRKTAKTRTHDDAAAPTAAQPVSERPRELGDLHAPAAEPAALPTAGPAPAGSPAPLSAPTAAASAATPGAGSRDPSVRRVSDAADRVLPNLSPPAPDQRPGAELDTSALLNSPSPAEAAAAAAAAPDTADAPVVSPAAPGAAGGLTGDPAADVRAADAAFRDRKYHEAGRIYAALAQANQLPKERRDHWAYCRCAEVVKRINTNPRTPADWASIYAEIQSIRALSPNMWYGEYLRNLAAERASAAGTNPPATGAGASAGAGAGAPQGSPGSKGPAAGGAASGGGAAGSPGASINPFDHPTRDPGAIVIRGAEPEEPEPTAAPPAVAVARPRAKPASIARPSPARVIAPVQTRTEPAIGNWQVLSTPNFRILHANPALAERVARAAEVAREEQSRRWTGKSPTAPWSPRCDIYLYTNAALFAQMTGQPEDSPGFSTMGLSGNRIIARRVNLRADHPNLVNAVLPHEVTHVVLADLFPSQQIPRWADEGMAVLAEPDGEQQLRANDLSEPLSTGRVFRMQDLMTTDYPDGKYWGLYYAQSVSLTRYLVEQGTPAQFIKFLQGAQRSNVETQLRQVYNIDGFTDLQRRWMVHARTTSPVATAVNDKGDSRKQ